MMQPTKIHVNTELLEIVYLNEFEYQIQWHRIDQRNSEKSKSFKRC
jgi:hypothetical protein